MRHYSNALEPTYLTARVEPTDTVIQVASKDGLPTAFPFTLTLSKREAVDVTGHAGSNRYAVVRGVDDTTALAHQANAIVSHDTTARDWREATDAAIGPPGPKGEPGVFRFHGTGPPGVLIGSRPGDEYLDGSTGDLYYLS